MPVPKERPNKHIPVSEDLNGRISTKTSVLMEEGLFITELNGRGSIE